MIKTIYLDMDDVLTDFSVHYHRIIGIDPKTITPDEWNENWHKWIKGNHFVTMPMHPEAKRLLEYVASTGIKTEILSSTGGPDYFEEICNQKSQWLQLHGIPYHVNFVPGKKYKTQFATRHRLLIDDQEGIIEKFRVAGGYGIVHDGDAERTIEELHTYLDNLGYKKYEEL